MSAMSTLPKDAEPVLGVIGGLGPAATAYFCELLVNMIEAVRDQDHLNTLIFNHGSIPDRTAFILGKSLESPGPFMAADARFLEQAGCAVLVIPCNTATYFLDEVQAAVSIPVLNIVEEAVRYCKRQGAVRVGVLSTAGTRQTGLYVKACEHFGLECLYPDEALQEVVTSVIYDYVKAGRGVPQKMLDELFSALFREANCDAIILGCTELSVVWRDYIGPWSRSLVVDSLSTLAAAALLSCGKTPKPVITVPSNASGQSAHGAKNEAER